MRVTLLIVEISLLSFAYVEASSVCSSHSLSPYELIFKTDGTTKQTGSITLICRNSRTTEELEVSEVNFFLNRTTANDPSLREREDIRVVEVGKAIKFNLTRKYDGHYTCGKRVDCANVRESMAQILICK